MLSAKAWARHRWCALSVRSCMASGARPWSLVMCSPLFFRRWALVGARSSPSIASTG